MFTLRKFADIKHHLPPDCWCRQRREFAAGGFDDEWVLHATGPVQLAQLDLAQPDVPGVQLPKGASVFLVLVQADADIGQLLSPGDDTGTAGVMVLGDLRLRNALLGGQELYVSGDLHVAELLWGNYNHGDLVVYGVLSASLLVHTDGYHLDLKQEAQVQRLLSDADDGPGHWDLLDMPTLASLLPSDCFWLGDDQRPVLDGGAMHARLSRGESVLNLAHLQRPPTPLPQVLPDRSPQLAHLLAISSPRRMLEPEAGKPAQFSVALNAAGLTHCHVMALPANEATQQAPMRMLAWSNAERQLVLNLTQTQAPQPGADGAPQPAAWQALFMGLARDEAGEMSAPQALPQPLPPVDQAMFEAGWPALIDAVAASDALDAELTGADLQALLALPVVQGYDTHFYDDGGGFWLGPAYLAFRREGSLHEGEAQPGLMRVTRELPDEDGELVAHHLFFERQQRVDGSTGVLVSIENQDEPDSYRDLDFQGDPELGLVLQTFRVVRALLVACNDELVEDGVVPDEDDGFALATWREMGLLDED